MEDCLSLFSKDNASILELLKLSVLIWKDCQLIQHLFQTLPGYSGTFLLPPPPPPRLFAYVGTVFMCSSKLDCKVSWTTYDFKLSKRILNPCAYFRYNCMPQLPNALEMSIVSYQKKDKDDLKLYRSLCFVPCVSPVGFFWWICEEKASPSATG